MPDEDRKEQWLREPLHEPGRPILPKPGAEARIRRTARRQRLRTICAGTAVLAAVAAAIVVPLTLLSGSSAAGGRQQRPAHALAASDTERETIMINPQIGMTFAPAPTSAAPKLTGQQAWAQYLRHLASPHTGIPSGVHVQLGLLTLPVGPASLPGTNGLPKSGGKAYTALNELAYGYSSPSGGSGCATLNPRLTPPPDARCISWTFLGANTGEQIDSTWQKVGNWHWLYNSKGL
jgi:hypothetical protein